MTFSLIFFLFGIFFLWAGSKAGAGGGPVSFMVSLMFYWAAVAELVTSFLYLMPTLFKANPGWAFKTMDGKVRLIPRLFSWPYLVFEYWGWKRYRKKTKEPLFEEVMPGLFLGGRPVDSDLDSLREAGVDAVLDMVAEFEAPRGLAENPEVVYLAIPVLDGSTPTLEDLAAGARFVDRAIEAGRRVYVHCTFGHGRSATMAAAALVRMGMANDRKQAVGVLKKLERRIWLTNDQKRVFDRYVMMSEDKDGNGDKED